jgi:hypothetical protein
MLIRGPNSTFTFTRALTGVAARRVNEPIVTGWLLVRYVVVGVYVGLVTVGGAVWWYLSYPMVGSAGAGGHDGLGIGRRGSDCCS